MTKKELQEKLGKETKYSRRYLKLLLHKQTLLRKKKSIHDYDYIYYENHHILPNSIFPEYKNLKEHSWNGVLLTYREHLLAHYLIYKHYNEINNTNGVIKMGNAMQLLIKLKNKSKYFKSKIYLSIKDELKLTTRGFVTCYNSNGTKIRVTTEEFKNNKTLVMHNKGMVKCKNINTNEILWIAKEDFYKNNNLVGILKGTTQSKEAKFKRSIINSKEKNPSAKRINIYNAKDELM